MRYIIAYRVGEGPILMVADAHDDTQPAVYPDMHAAIDYARNNRLFQSGQAVYQLIDLNI